MANLAETVAQMARYRKALAASGLATVRPDRPLASASDRSLADVADFGPNPGALKMKIYRPAGLGQGAALVVVLHGCQQAAQPYADDTGWLTLADEYGFAVLCPEQVRTNNSFGCFNWFEPGDIARGGGEAASIHHMITHALARYGLDWERVFVTGLSAGGAMTNVLLADYPEAFAGGAIIAGLPYGIASDTRQAFAAMYQGCDLSAATLGGRVRAAAPRPARWPRLSIWQGDADATVRPENANAIVRQWTNVLALPPLAGEVERKGLLERQVWLDGKGAPVIERVTVKGLGHGTPIATQGPDACGQPGPFVLDAGVSSSREIARFWGLATEGPRRTSEASSGGAPPDPPTHHPRGIADLLKSLVLKF